MFIMRNFIFLAIALILGVVFNAGTCTPDAFDEGVEINGVTWATRNVGAPGKFVASPADAGMFYQWNNKKGFSATGNVTGWSTTPAASPTWETKNDPCPRGWRVPTKEELESLLDASVTKTYGESSGVKGVYIGTAPDQIFLPAAGRREGPLASDVYSVGEWAHYWSSTLSSFYSENSHYLYSHVVDPTYIDESDEGILTFGFSISIFFR